jgi:hypothetical protein
MVGNAVSKDGKLHPTATDKPAKIGGEVLSYNCPTFDSPWLQGADGSGVVTLTGPLSGEKLVLDFNKAIAKK